MYVAKDDIEVVKDALRIAEGILRLNVREMEAGAEYGPGDQTYALIQDHKTRADKMSAVLDRLDS